MAQSTLRIVIAQLNLHVGNIKVNTKKIIHSIKHAKEALQADLVVFPELTITGYPPEDLLLRSDFTQAVANALDEIALASSGIDVVVGHPHSTNEGVYNAASVFQNGTLALRYYKQYRPNYSVFDEKRYFKRGHESGIFIKDGLKIGVVICEDLWRDPPAQQAKAAGAQLLLSLNASPFHVNKPQERENIMCARAKENHLPIIYIHCVGGQDMLMFDGGSMVIDAAGEVCQRCSFYEERLSVVECTIENSEIKISRTALTELPTEEASIYGALRLGIRDYVHKNNFSDVIIGLSGGIDSALTLTIAVDALGAEHVRAVMLPTRFTSEMSRSDAQALAQSLGVYYEVVDIDPVFENFLQMLNPSFCNLPENKAEENIQARIRAVVLMALSNKFGSLLISTGNKSEMAVGYATLYGDMAGAFSVLGDVYKTWVYRLAEYRNRTTPVIPKRIITRAPTAELRLEQIDQDSLPPYEILDKILYQFVEEDKSITDIVAMGFDQTVVRKVINLVSLSEYKRRQAPPCVRISKRAFGRDRRYPITSGFEF